MIVIPISINFNIQLRSLQLFYCRIIPNQIDSVQNSTVIILKVSGSARLLNHDMAAQFAMDRASAALGSIAHARFTSLTCKDNFIWNS